MNHPDQEDINDDYLITPEEQAALRARYKCKKDLYRVMYNRMVSALS
jgi:hypothetical protein